MTSSCKPSNDTDICFIQRTPNMIGMMIHCLHSLGSIHQSSYIGFHLIWNSIILWPLVFVSNNILILGIWFYNTSPRRMFLSLDLLWEYRIQHGANGPLYVTSSNSTWIFCRGVSGFATDCPWGVWCRGLTTCLLHVGPPFGNRILNNSWAVGLT